MATLDETLRVFADLLAAGPSAETARADEAVWTYLIPFQGLQAQIRALEDLCAGTGHLDAGSPFMPVLADILARHRARLAEGQG